MKSFVYVGSINPISNLHNILWGFSEISDESSLLKIYQEDISKDLPSDSKYEQQLRQLAEKLNISSRVEFYLDTLALNLDDAIYLSPQLSTSVSQREKSQYYCDKAIVGITTDYFLQNTNHKNWLILPVENSTVGNFVDPKQLRLALDQQIILASRSSELPKRFQLSPWIEEKNDKIIIQDLIYGKIEIENNDQAFMNLYNLGHLSDITN